MKPRWILAAGAAVFLLAACLLWIALSVSLVWSTLDVSPPTSWIEIPIPVYLARWPLLLLAAIPVLFLIGLIAWHGSQRWIIEFHQIAEASHLLLKAGQSRFNFPAQSQAGKQLLGVLQQLAYQRDEVRADIAEQVAIAGSRLEQERSRLAALMSELSQSVVVCNRDGRIILYNRRARLQFKALSKLSWAHQGTELLGIGRSIFTAFDEQLIQHAVESIERRLRNGADQPHAQFVTHTHGGQLLRVQVAPVLSTEELEGDAHAPRAALSGYVLTLENITQTFESDTLRDRQVLQWLQSARAIAGNILCMAAISPASGQAADLRAQADSLVGLLGDALSEMRHQSPTRWPLEEALASDWLELACHRIGKGSKVQVTVEHPAEPILMRVDSYGLLQVVHSLVQRLNTEYEVRRVRLRISKSSGRVYLDVVWPGLPLSTETVMSWEMDGMRIDEVDLPLSARDVLTRHGGQMWFERDRPRHEGFFRLDLPSTLTSFKGTSSSEVLPARTSGRPEYYDFDLFQMSPQVRALEDQMLSNLVYTVFDTETTGLNPRDGDEIIQIGATRIVNSKILTTEVFDQLVDPRRRIPAQSTSIHGITQEMVEGQPPLERVLPAFHAFAKDSVLVGHNVAFDMKFLEIKSESLGVAFNHPVLDTLLIAAVLYPSQKSNRLDALAERYGLAIQGRHTALGDALVTAELFARFVPQLQSRGIYTLRQAIEASRATYLARLNY